MAVDYGRSFEFVVLGRPQPKGSTVSFRSASTGRTVTRSSNPRLAGWERAVALAAIEARVPMLSGPVEIEVYFRFARPKDHYHKGRKYKYIRIGSDNGDLLCGRSPYFAWVNKRNDLDKLLRATFDGMSGVCFEDDSQVVSVIARKIYTQSEECAAIVVRELIEVPGECSQCKQKGGA
jgi:crossover junction endodeoxyribonuclease RusA